MKNLNSLKLAVLFGLTMLLGSCSSDSETKIQVPATGSYVQATIAGTPFSATGNFVVGSYSSGSLSVVGVTLTGRSLAIQLSPTVNGATLQKTTYNMNSTNDGKVAIGNINFSDALVSATALYSSSFCDNADGSLTITYIDDQKIEGTFTCTVKENKMTGNICDGVVKTVANGSFRIELK